jgi:hypothetical protein
LRITQVLIYVLFNIRLADMFTFAEPQRLSQIGFIALWVPYQ